MQRHAERELGVIGYPSTGTMITTLDLDEGLVSEAKRLSGLEDPSALVRAALRVLIERESARRLALLGGTDPQLEDIPRRRSGFV